MFKAQNKVRLSDTDASGVLYFGKQFRFAQETFEDFLEVNNISVLNNPYSLAVRHCIADYFSPIKVGDVLQITMTIETIGRSSFKTQYKISNSDGILVGTVILVHVTVDKCKRLKISLPDSLKTFLEESVAFVSKI